MFVVFQRENLGSTECCIASITRFYSLSLRIDTELVEAKTFEMFEKRNLENTTGSRTGPQSHKFDYICMIADICLQRNWKTF